MPKRLCQCCGLPEKMCVCEEIAQEQKNSKNKIVPKKVWNCGDMCYHDFELCEVVAIKNGNVCGLTTGYMGMSTMDFRDEMLPISIRTKLISEKYSDVAHQVHKMNCGLNFPDLIQYLQTHWYETCTFFGKGADDDAVDKYLQKRYAELDDFLAKLRTAVSPSHMVHGVQIFSKNFPRD